MPAEYSAPSLCAENPLGTSECEYVFFGKWDMSLLEYACCAHGLSEPATIELSDPGFQCDANAQHAAYYLVLSAQSYDQGSDISRISFELQYHQSACDATDPTNLGCCRSDLKAVNIQSRLAASVVGVQSAPDVTPKVSVGLSSVNVTGAFGAGSNSLITLLVRGFVPPTGAGAFCDSPGCTYRMYGGTSYTNPNNCCPTDYTWATGFW